MARNRVVLLLGLGLILGQAESARAISLSISPTAVRLGPRAGSALLSIGNQGAETVEFEVSVYSWTVDESGRSRLSPSDDLIVFPLVSSVAAQGQRRLRIGRTRRGSIAVEQSYRILIEELPRPQSTPIPGEVKVRMQFSIPIFVEPAKPSGTLVLDRPALQDGTLAFRIRNPGNAHVRVKEVTATSRDSEGAVVGRHDLPAWYLLAQSARSYEVALAPEECSAAREVQIEVRSENESSSERIGALPAHCPRESFAP